VGDGRTPTNDAALASVAGTVACLFGVDRISWISCVGLAVFCACGSDDGPPVGGSEAASADPTEGSATDSGGSEASAEGAAEQGSTASSAGGETGATGVSTSTSSSGTEDDVEPTGSDATSSTLTSVGESTSGEAESASSEGGLEMGVEIDGRTIVVDGVPFHIRGVCWNPVPRGGTHPANLDYAGAVQADSALMAEAGINAIRSYEPITDVSVLDALYAQGIYVLNTVYPYGGNEPSTAVDAVLGVKDHPAILMWVIGNEWNYNGLYVDLSHEASLARINEVAGLIRGADDGHPIATVYGELPSAETIGAMPEIDVWGLNIYNGLSFGTRFADWAARSEKPVFIGEYGADAWNANSGAQDLAAQAEATRVLTQAIWDESSAFDPDGIVAGGTIFEWADEWWKDGGGSPDAQDIGGIAPGGGPHPDQTFNEEWWGIVDIDRNPRPAYDALAEIFL